MLAWKVAADTFSTMLRTCPLGEKNSAKGRSLRLVIREADR